jgi:hypothetical protein
MIAKQHLRGYERLLRPAILMGLAYACISLLPKMGGPV